MDNSLYLQFVISLILVLSLLGLAAIGLKKYGGFGPGMKPMDKRRLKLTEVLHIDARKKIVIVQHDQTEHVILCGVNSDLLISSKSTAAQRSDA